MGRLRDSRLASPSFSTRATGARLLRLTWRPYAAVARRIGDDARREAYLSFYGPLSLVLLVGVWAFVLVLGFGVLHWADGQGDFGTDLYLSGTTFFTLGLGDVVPNSGMARALTVIEAGTGFGFLALVIGYLPIVYQMFARREMNVSLLDQRAGSPPSAAELLRRNVDSGDLSLLIQLLHDWEIWLADLLENHLSYPALAYFRSQHENQSWVAALAVILDVCAVGLACGGRRQPPGGLHLRGCPPCRRRSHACFVRATRAATGRSTGSRCG